MVPAIEMRLLRSEQLEFLRLLRNDYRVRRWLNTQDEISCEQQRRWFSTYMEDLDWLIFIASDQATGEMVGYGQLKCSDQDAVELGCAVKPEMWDEGYGTAIVQWLTSYVDQKLSVACIWLQVHADNDAALALYKHCGFETTGEIGEPIIREGIAIPRLRMVFGG